MQETGGALVHAGLEGHFPHYTLTTDRSQSKLSDTHIVVFETSFMLVRGSELSGQRKRHGAKMIARALGDMRFISSIRATLKFNAWNKSEYFSAHFARNNPIKLFPSVATRWLGGNSQNDSLHAESPGKWVKFTSCCTKQSARERNPKTEIAWISPA